MNARRVAVTGTVAVLAAGCLTLAWARRKLILITVKGDSMAPTYRSGQRLLVRRGGYQAGQVVVFRPPSPRVFDVDWLVKRAVAVAGDPVPADLSERAAVGVVPAGRLLVRSDAPDGLDSRQLGLIDNRDVLGVVRYPRVRPAPA
jgi:signal peptidase I